MLPLRHLRLETYSMDTNLVSICCVCKRYFNSINTIQNMNADIRVTQTSKKNIFIKQIYHVWQNIYI